ncbi:Insulinase (Peptidase M16) [Chytriomyces hyalinus]|nr:Insulinase (Peptidase M16) [Chytriomyces hyalinus]
MNTTTNENIDRPSIDDRQYRIVTLKNELTALLISDAESDRASAAMDVRVGYLSDPEDAPGLAHFLEHLLFLGTEKYPKENEYSQYLSDIGGGYSNAFTAAENTNYYFEVAADPGVLEGALDRFAQFFVAPLFDESCTERELNAVDSEHKKNVQDDDWRSQQLEQDLASSNHPFSKFGTGNLDTLKTIPESKGLKTRDMCIDFYKANYSANIMNLVVLGKESLDQLQAWVEEKFSSIENKRIVSKVFPDNPLGPSELGKLIRMKPVKDQQNLTMIFPWPDTSKLYLKAPNNYICHLIGHESEGSILSLLKEKGLAISLACYPSHGATGFDFFKIQITLSDKGLESWQEVIILVFSYIQMMKECEPLQWIYDECAIMSNLSFKYQEKGAPSSFCSALAANMHDYPAKHIISGGYLMEDFDTTLLKTLIQKLSPDNFRAFLVASSAEVEGWKTAPWYGTEFKVEELPPSLLQTLSNITMNPQFKLFKMNPFVPHSFDIVPDGHTVDVFEHPRIIKETPTTRVWYLLETKFKVPRASFSLFIKSPVAYASPRFSVMTNLYCELLKDAMNEISYYAEMAGLYYGLDVTVEGLILSVGGYSDNLGLFLEEVAKKMVSLTVDPDRFVYIKENCIREYSNFGNENPDSHASYFMTWILQERLWTDSEKLQEIADITPEEVARFYPTLFNPSHIESFVHGTYNRAFVLDLHAKIEQILAGPSVARSLPVHARFNATRTFQLPESTSLTYRRHLPNKENLNNAVEVYFQFGEPSAPSWDLYCKTLLLDQITSEPCFDTLRTKEQLGYIAWSAPRFATGMCGFLVHVQSEKHPRHVESRILNFVEERMGEVLEVLTEEEFSRHVSTLATKLVQKQKYMMEATEFYCERIGNGSYFFEGPWLLAERVRQLTRADIIDFYQQFLKEGGANRSKLSVQIWSAQGLKAAVDDGIVHEDLMDVDSMGGDRVITSELGIADLRRRWTIGGGAASVAPIESFFSLE